MKKISLFILLFCATQGKSQELYVFSEPASNMPAHSISAKLTGHFAFEDNIYGRLAQRYMPEIMFGISKKLMIHLSGTFGNMHTKDTGFFPEMISINIFGWRLSWIFREQTRRFIMMRSA
jgi:hypothetical protein